MLTGKNSEGAQLDEVAIAKHPTPRKLLRNLGSFHDSNMVNAENINRLNRIFHRLTGGNIEEVADAPVMKEPETENLDDISAILGEEAKTHSQLLTTIIERLEEYV
jgi:hypothetical protein